MGLWISCTVVPLFICFLISAGTALKSAASVRNRDAAFITESKPVWPVVRPAYRIDLRSVVKEPFAFMPIGPGTQEPRSGIPIRSLGFLDDERLVVTVVTRGRGKPGLPRRGAPSAESPYRLDAILIRASTGKIIGAPDWPSNSRYAGIAALNDRGLVIQTGNELQLISVDLQRLIKRMPLSPLPTDKYAHDSFWTPHSSWSGRRLLMLGWHTASSTWLWVDTENLKVLEPWQGVVTGSVAVSDDRLVMEKSSPHFGDPPPVLEDAFPGGEWKALDSIMNPSGAQFVGPGLLLFHRFGTLDLPEGSGTYLMHIERAEPLRLESPRKGWGLGQAAVSRAGKRFVILALQVKGSHPAFDIGGHTVLKGLLVYDPPFALPSCTLEVAGSRVKNPDLVALSPDGCHLAVFSYPEPLLEVFNLPPCK